jgi:hypothetical protein
LFFRCLVLHHDGSAISSRSSYRSVSFFAILHSTTTYYTTQLLLLPSLLLALGCHFDMGGDHSTEFNASKKNAPLLVSNHASASASWWWGLRCCLFVWCGVCVVLWWQPVLQRCGCVSTIFHSPSFTTFNPTHYSLCHYPLLTKTSSPDPKKKQTTKMIRSTSRSSI